MSKQAADDVPFMWYVQNNNRKLCRKERSLSNYLCIISLWSSVVYIYSNVLSFALWPCGVYIYSYVLSFMSAVVGLYTSMARCIISCPIARTHNNYLLILLSLWLSWCLSYLFMLWCLNYVFDSFDLSVISLSVLMSQPAKRWFWCLTYLFGFYEDSLISLILLLS